MKGSVVLLCELGDGCDDWMTRWRGLMVRASPRASLPHRMKTAPSVRLFTASMIASVTGAQPLSLCEFASPFWTVSARFKSSTPRRAQAPRFPVVGYLETPESGSASSSLKMLSNDRGIDLSLQENARPWAWPGPWYGSWPTMTILTSSSLQASNAAKIWSWGGYTATPSRRLPETKSAIVLRRRLGTLSTALRHDSGTRASSAASASIRRRFAGGSVGSRSTPVSQVVSGTSEHWNWSSPTSEPAGSTRRARHFTHVAYFAPPSWAQYTVLLMCGLTPDGVRTSGSSMSSETPPIEPWSALHLAQPSWCSDAAR
mmetsp:Transcript_25427/g.66075  ORF Transcript_25427/g.66075 Transcript_25427/m.66075 type:complete len:315 (+) Transcript_25427:538-1482(+)